MKNKILALSFGASLLIAAQAQAVVTNNASGATSGNGTLIENNASGAGGARINSNTRTQNNLSSSTGTSVTPPANMTSQQFDNFVISRWGVSNNGTLTTSQWNAIDPAWFNGSVPQFSTLDTNRNGVLGQPELRAYFSSHPDFFSYYDTNHNGIIDSTEAARIPVK
jgi:hypothetical protein